jgi:hypothetical protein
VNIKGLARASASGGASAEAMLAAGVPIAVSVEEVVKEDGSEIKGRLIVDAFGTKAGTRVTLRDPEADGRWGSMTRAFSPPNGGDDRCGPGDVLAFASAFVRDGIAYVGKVGARTHAAQDGEVQVMTAMVRAGQTRVSEKAKTTTQWITVADGAAAAIARKVDDVGAILSAAAARPWLGSGVGALLRSRSGDVVEFFSEGANGIDYLLEELHHQEAFGDGAIEVVPAWRLLAGREQSMRELRAGAAPTTPVSGMVTRSFEHASIKGQGFLPCLLVTCDEEQWAFGGKTGKVARVAAGMQPLFKRDPVSAARLPSTVRPYGGTPNPVRTMHPAATVAALAASRAAGRPEPVAQRDMREEASVSSGLTRSDGSARFPGLRRPTGPRP